MILLAKLLVSLALFGLFLISLRVDWSRITSRRFNAIACIGLAVTRVTVFVVLYLVLNLPPHSDNIGYYKEAKAAAD